MSRAAPRHVLEYAAFLAFMGLVRVLPHRAARGLGALLGGLGHRLDRRHRRVALANVAAAFPELDEPTKRRLVRDCFCHFAGVACDNLSVRRFDASALCRRLTLVGWEHLEEAARDGRGLFLMTGHLGNFEMLAHPVALYRGPAWVIDRPADNPLLDRALRRLRGRFGNRRIARRGAGRAALRALRDGGQIFILADQRVGPHEGIELPFFGRPAVTSTLTARLSLRCGSPVVPLFCYPTPGGGFRVEVQPAIRPPAEPHRPRGVEIEELTRRYVEVLEQQIRRHPEMWLWMHDRWRARPEAGGEP